MSNFLGIQIFNALPGTRTGPLSSTCQNILGVSGRRLEGGGGIDDYPSLEGFNLEVEYNSDSFVEKQDMSINNEEEILRKEQEIIDKEDMILEKIGEIQTTLDDQNALMICANNYIMGQFAETIATANGVINITPTLSEECSILLGLDRRLMEGVSHQKMVLKLPENYKTASDIYVEVDDVEETEKDIQKTMNNMMNTVNDIARKLDMDVVEPKKKKPKTPKKPKHAKQPEAQEEEDALFKRHLLAIEGVKDKFDKVESQVKSVESKIESVATKDDVKVVKSKFGSTGSKVESIEGKLKSMESKVESIEGKVESTGSKVKSIEGKVESIEGKVESMEKTMEELKEMLSQLLAKGGVVG